MLHFYHEEMILFQERERVNCLDYSLVEVAGDAKHATFMNFS